MTHDEVLTAVRYPKFTYWQIMMFPEVWPNNHILNSLLSKFFIGIFGYGQWVVRLANTLAFLVYGYAVFRTNRTVFTTSSVFFIPASILFLCNPYLLDFFGLSRGYGLACAFSTLSVSFLISGYKDFRPKDIWLAFFLAMAASYANFTVLLFWVALTLFVWFFFFISFRKRGTGLLKPTVLILCPLLCMGF